MSAINIEAEEPKENLEIDSAASLSTDMTDSEKQAQQSTPPATPALDWDGPDDPDNPVNWPLWQRVYHATTPGLFGFAV